MANSLSLQVIGSYTDGTAGITYQKSWSNSFTVTNNTALQTVQNIGTTAEALTLGDITAPAYLFFRCLHATTNSILLGVTSTTTLCPVRARAGLGFGVFEVNGNATVYAQATPNAADLEYLVLPL